MGITAKPIGKMASLFKKIDNENEKQKQAMKTSKKEGVIKKSN